MCYTQDEFVIQKIGPMTPEGRKAVLVKRTASSVKIVVLLQPAGTTVTAIDLKTETVRDCKRLQEGQTDIDLSDWKPGDVLTSFLHC